MPKKKKHQKVYAFFLSQDKLCACLWWADEHRRSCWCPAPDQHRSSYGEAAAVHVNILRFYNNGAAFGDSERAP